MLSGNSVINISRGQNGAVSLNEVAACYSLVQAGNAFFKRPRMEADQSTGFTENFKNTSVFFMFLAGNLSRIKSSWKSTKRIWIEASKPVDCEYHGEIVYKFIHNKNRWKEVLVSNL